MKYTIGVILLGIIVIGAVAATRGSSPATSNPTPVPTETPTPTPPTPVTPTPTPSSSGVISLAETKTINGVTLKPLAVVEESRCPQGVQCIWAGTVRVRTQISTNGVSTTTVIELGKSVIVSSKGITLASVTPGPVAGIPVKSGDYRFVFNVKTVSVSTPPPVAGGCFVGGCSSQICSEDPHAISTCEYRQEYACYKTAACERQASGQCGWTDTAALRMCLASAPPPTTSSI
jgi:hypothetical protein